jgi:hypothetical protein
MTLSATTFKLRFAEFRSETDATIELALEDARADVDEYTFGDDLDRALGWLAAHHLLVRRTTGSGQLVKSETIGPITTTYDTQASTVIPDPSDYSTTSYGARYLNLLTKKIPPVFVI